MAADQEESRAEQNFNHLVEVCDQQQALMEEPIISNVLTQDFLNDDGNVYNGDPDQEECGTSTPTFGENLEKRYEDYDVDCKQCADFTKDRTSGLPKRIPGSREATTSHFAIERLVETPAQQSLMAEPLLSL